MYMIMAVFSFGDFYLIVVFLVGVDLGKFGIKFLAWQVSQAGLGGECLEAFQTLKIESGPKPGLRWANKPPYVTLLCIQGSDADLPIYRLNLPNFSCLSSALKFLIVSSPLHLIGSATKASWTFLNFFLFSRSPDWLSHRLTLDKKSFQSVN